MENKQSSVWKIKLIEICKILINNGIDIQKIHSSRLISDGKRVYTKLKDINIEGIDINKIIIENGLDEDFPIGKYLRSYRLAYNGIQGKLTPKEREDGEKTGIILDKHSKNATKPIGKFKKLSQFHLNYINTILEKILSGEINIREARNLLEQESIKNNEIIIKDVWSINRGVEILLKDNPEKLKQYRKTLSGNVGRRNSKKGDIGKHPTGEYYVKEKEFKKNIIEYWLPLFLSRKVTVEDISKKISTSNGTINKVIEDYYTNNNDMDGLKKYRETKKRNKGMGNTIKGIEIAQSKREEVENYNISTKAEFSFLNQEEQESELIRIIRMEQLKEELSKTSSRKTALTSQEYVRSKINDIMNYFRNKNNNDEIYFSDEDIRFMIFRYPTLVKRTSKTLDEKIEALTSYKEIDEETAYGMIKEFPALIGYDASRTKRQLDLLVKENLIDAVISTPRTFMISVNLMYALINFAKERYKTSDLSNISSNNIFIGNSILKKRYGVSSKEIQDKYNYKIEEKQDKEFTVSIEEIAEATNGHKAKSEEAEKVLKEAMYIKEKGIQ